MTELQTQLLEMLSDVKDFCDKNNIQYFLTYGTLLGAVRHGGYIPWDDDLDIVMKQKDYEAFIKIANTDKEFSKKYFFQNFKTDSNTQCPWGKIRKNNTCMILEGDYPFNMHMGAWIDIFPLYDARRNNVMKKMQVFCSKLYYILMIDNSKCKVKHKKFKVILFKIFKKNFILALLQHFIEYKNNKSSEFIIIGEYLSSPITKKIFYSNSLNILFENTYFPIPIGYKEILKSLYGDYMTMPPIEDRVNHSPMYVDFNNSYENYIELAKQKYKNK